MKSFHFFLIFIFLIFASLGIFVLAQTLEGITFPIAELGNCANQTECEAYCDLPENREACLDFAEDHNLIPADEIRIARRMLELGETGGPGGCQGTAECEAYCDDISHIEECITFAERYGLIPPEELIEAKKVAAAIARGVNPPNCNNKRDCDVYCAQPENMEECLTFAEAADLIPPDELVDAKKALQAVRKGVKPPPCRGRVECDAYCSAPENLEACLTFAEAAGFISPEEAAMARKTGGKGPGDCRGKEACEAYCEDPNNAEECINFAIEYGFMSPEEAEQAKKMLAAGLTGGPGGCKGKEECESYCNDLSHMEECVDFAVKAGFMSPEEAEQAKKMVALGITSGPGGCKGEEECRAFCENPTNAEECLNFAVRVGQMSPEEAERARQGVTMMQAGGPGGCKSESECKAYCEDPVHGEECVNFSLQQGFMSPEEAQKMLEMMKTGPPSEGMMPPAGEIPPGGIVVPQTQTFQGPGGCTNEEECRAYCSDPAHATECQALIGPSLPIQPAPEYSPPPEYTPPAEYVPPPEYTPPPESQPQSFFDRARQFLASLITLFGF